MSESILDMESLHLRDSQSLETLPLDILLIILAYLDTARSIAGLAATCKRLYEVMKVNGWRMFVWNRFDSLTLPQSVTGGGWHGLAQELTKQSRDWERRAFSVVSWTTPTKRPPRNQHNLGNVSVTRRFRMQTVPCQVMVDATLNIEGKARKETVVWGAGEDVVARIRKTDSSPHKSEDWFALEGAPLGFKSGKDDVTSISILEQPDATASILVGRASGDLRLLSMGRASFGQTQVSFRPFQIEHSGAQIEQNEIQSCDIDSFRGSLAAVTKDTVLRYPLAGQSAQTQQNDSATDGILPPHVNPTEALNLRAIYASRPFKFLRSIKFMGNGDLAVGMASSYEPLRYLTTTPTGSELIAVAKMSPSDRCAESNTLNNRDLGTVRDILPLDAASIAGGHGNVVLSSYDDATIRLQDLRTSSAIDTIYQDHFEVSTPVGPLVSYGMDRFIAGSARSSTLKIFDFRWTKRYHYTDALPCRAQPLLPLPRPPTIVPSPDVGGGRRCNHLLGRLCMCHALQRTDFYRPNCNVYLPVVHQSASPVYSLAKASDLSPTVFAGLAGELVEMSLGHSDDLGRPQPKYRANPAEYSQHRGIVSLIETGDGIALNDISKSQRVPEIRKQIYRADRTPNVRHTMFRLDDWLM
ncbi:F-box domain-containing protein [Xylariales sp. AK1849]|nr:F-box domain-containing protein [Xylariales sp. AK1849]